MKIQLNPLGQSIAAGNDNRPVEPRNSDFARLLGQKSDALQYRQNVSGESNASSSGAQKNTHLVKLGRVTKDVPTVSDLLIGHSEFKNDCWRIIHSEVNRGKNYTRISAGTEIYINPETRELVWDKTDCGGDPPGRPEAAEISRQDAGLEVSSARAEGGNAFSEQLADVVQSYVGRPYSEMNCYEMVVEGLKTMGVRYGGNGGLAERLQEMAVQQGMSRYAYFNGEGLIKASGSNVYSRTLSSVEDFARQSEKIMTEIEPLLEKGMLLSFSTTSRGHTGVISQRDQSWTFINSGWIDHDIENGRHRRAVGEETLGDEIRNWLKLAADKKEPLNITVGRFGENQLQAFLQNRPHLSRTV